MASALTAETEDLLTCSVCLIEYDHEERKPKFLQCAHTACIKCLQLIWKDGGITCPICRKKSFCSFGPSNLSNNLYALHMIDMLKKHNQVIKKLLKPCWCVVCSKIASVSCLDSHLLVGIPSDKITMGNELENIVHECKCNLGMGKKGRMGIIDDLETLAALMQVAEKEIRSQINVNRCCIQDLDRLEASLSKPSQVVESYGAFKERVMKMSKEIESECRKLANERDLDSNVNVFIQIEKDNKVVPTFYGFQDGFCKDIESPELKLLYHMILSILRRRKIPLKPLPAPPIAPFTTFIVEVHAKNEVFGQIHIKPSAFFYESFLRDLRNFLFDGKQIFECSVSKVRSQMFAVLDFQHCEFCPKEPEMWSGVLAQKSLDVGFGRYSNQDGRITGWELVLLAQDATIKHSPLFGKVIRGHDVISELSNRKWNEIRSLKAVWDVV